MDKEIQTIPAGYGRYYIKKEDYNELFNKDGKYSEKELDAMDAFMDSLYQTCMIERTVKKLWCRMADVRPNIKIYNGTIPKRGELERLKKEKAYQGALVLFKSVDSGITDLKEIFSSRPALKSAESSIPAVSEIKQLSKNPEADGYLVIFEKLNEQEHLYVYTDVEEDESEETTV